MDCAFGCRWRAHSGVLVEPRRAFTKIELLVVITIISLLTSITLPAIQSVRERSRITHCQNNLRQFGVAIANFESAHRKYPSLEGHKKQLAAYLEIPLGKAPPSETPEQEHERISRIKSPVMICPSDGFGLNSDFQPTNYAASVGSGGLQYGSNGFFSWPKSFQGYLAYSIQNTTPSMMQNGMSNIAAMAEILHSAPNHAPRLRVLWNTRNRYKYGPIGYADLYEECERLPPDPTSCGYVINPLGRAQTWVGEIDLYNHALPPNRPSCLNETDVGTGVYSAGSLHPGGVNVLYGDGHVGFVSVQVDREVWRKQGSRSSSLATLPD